MSLQTWFHFRKETTSNAECSLSEFGRAEIKFKHYSNVATQALCFASDLVFSDRVRSVMKYALCKIEKQSENFSKQRHARGCGTELLLPGTTGKPFSIKYSM